MSRSRRTTRTGADRMRRIRSLARVLDLEIPTIYYLKEIADLEHWHVHLELLPWRACRCALGDLALQCPKLAAAHR